MKDIMITHRTNSRGDPYSYKNGHPLLAARYWAKNKQRDWEGPRSCDDSENPIVISPLSLSLSLSHAAAAIGRAMKTCPT